MKILPIYNLVILGLLLLCFSSCEKLVEVDDPMNQLNTQQIFSSTATAESALSALYTEMQMSSLISGGALGSGALLGSYTDDLRGYNVTSTNATMDIYNNIQTPSNITVSGVWTNAYKEIFMANAIISGVENSSSIPIRDGQRIKGEAIVIRSIIYFYLTQIFGEIPYTKTTDHKVNQSLTKTSEDQIMNLISADMQSAISMLEDAYRDTERVYINKKAAEFFLALVYMHQNKWSEAESLFKVLVQSPLYQWQSDISKTFKKDSKNILFQLKPLLAGNATSEAMLYYFYTTEPRDYAASSSLITAFSSNDFRLLQWFERINSTQQLYYKINKYKVISQNTDEYSVVFRLEEVYLLLAESLVNQGRVQESLNYLNRIRQKSGLTDISDSVSQDNLKTELINEFQREFFTERGIRFLCLKRNQKLDILKNVKPNWKDFHLNWPLPLSELALNPNLNPQNNGY